MQIGHSVLRELSESELESVAGGDGGTIVVTGKRTSSGLVWGQAGTSGTGDVPVPDDHESITPGGGLDMSLDEDSIDIEIKINRQLSDAEKAAIEKLKTTIAAIEAAIKALSDSAKLTLANGATVTGAQLKAIWAKTDFVINDNHVGYDNNSYLGEANKDRRRLSNQLQHWRRWNRRETRAYYLRCSSGRHELSCGS